MGDARRQGDVDASSVEDGGDGQGDGLDNEGEELEGVGVQHDTTAVSGNLKETAQNHAGHVAPSLPSDSQVDVAEHD